MEDCTKCEDIESNNTNPMCCQVNQTSSDTRSLIDNKNAQVRVVRGTKKLKIDNNESTNIEKKGALIVQIYILIREGIFVISIIYNF